MPAQGQPMAQPLSAQGNEQRFLRQSFAASAAGAAQWRQKHLADLVNAQRNANNSLYLGGTALPPNYQPVWQAQQAAGLPQQWPYPAPSEQEYPIQGVHYPGQAPLTQQLNPYALPQRQYFATGAAGNYGPHEQQRAYNQRTAQEALLGYA